MTDKADPQLTAIRNRFDIAGHRFANYIVKALKEVVKQKTKLILTESGKSVSNDNISLQINGQFTPEDVEVVKDTIQKFMDEIRNPHNFIAMVKKYSK